VFLTPNFLEIADMSARLLTLALISAALALPAVAQAAPAAAPANSLVMQLVMFLPLILIFYFLLIRPQQQRQKKHTAMIAAIKRGDTVVTSGGLIGKVNKVSDTEISVDLAENVRVRVVKGMILEVRNKSEPVPAND
jgi:preprotein translocase subunit YajC